jgi:hypothetical protein
MSHWQCSLKKRKKVMVSLVRKMHTSARVHYFQSLYDQASVEKMKSRRSLPNVVCLDGRPGAAMSDVLTRVSMLRYATSGQSLLELIESHRAQEGDANLSSVARQWIERWFDVVNRTDERPKDNVRFVCRSPLTLIDVLECDNERDDVIARFNDARGRCNVSMFWCVADPIKARERVGWKHLRLQEDGARDMAALYERLVQRDFWTAACDDGDESAPASDHALEASHADARLYTTDAKQASAALFYLLGIEPSFFSTAQKST